MKYEIAWNGYRAVVDSHGGELISFRDPDGKEYIWDGNPEYWSGRNPLLFPFVGTLKNGTVRFDGVAYEMSRHGFARSMEYAMVEQTEDRIVMELRDNEETLAKYPYHFQLQVIQQLVEGGFVTTLSVKNTGEKEMPFCIGAHTAFCCPMEEGEIFGDYEIVFDQKETAPMLVLTPQGEIAAGMSEPWMDNQDRFTLDHEVFARVDTIILEQLKSTGVNLQSRKSGCGVRMEFEDFPMLAFWTNGAKKAPYICIEPWYGCAAIDNESGDFEDKPHCIILQPGEVKELSYRVGILNAGK